MSSDTNWGDSLIGASGEGGATCVADGIRFAVIGCEIGLGVGIAIDVTRNSRPMVRLSIAFLRDRLEEVNS